MRPDEQPPPAGEGRTPREIGDAELNEALAEAGIAADSRNRAIQRDVLAALRRRELLPSAPEAEGAREALEEVGELHRYASILRTFVEAVASGHQTAFDYETLARDTLDRAQYPVPAPEAREGDGTREVLSWCRRALADADAALAAAGDYDATRGQVHIALARLQEFFGDGESRTPASVPVEGDARDRATEGER